MDNLEMAQEGLEHARHHAGAGGHEHGSDPWTRRAAVLIAVLAAAAVVGEMSTNDAQTEYLTAHIAASDTWNQYQAKSVRRAVYGQSAALLDAAGQAGPAEAARRDAARMASDPGRDGMEQLAERAHEHEHQRERERHLHDGLERGVRGLQIAIVLVSLFVVTGVRWLLIGGAALGAVAAAYALAAGFGAA